MAPWLFYVFKFNTEDPKITRQLLFIPILIYFVASGAYPGIFISTFFIMPIFVSLQLIDSYLKHTGCFSDTWHFDIGNSPWSYLAVP